MSLHRIHLFILLGLLLISAWEPAIGIEAVPHPSTSTTWQVLHAAFHKYGISPYPDFIPWQSSAPGPAPATAGQPQLLPDHAAGAAAGGDSSMQCSTLGTCSQPDAPHALPPEDSPDAATAGMQQPPPLSSHQGDAAAAHVSPAAVQVPSPHNGQPPFTAAVSGTQQHPAAVAAAAAAAATTAAAAPTPTDTSQLVAPTGAAATGVQTVVQPHAAPTPAPAAAPTRLHRPPPVRRLLNLAELSDGASVMAANPEARRPERAIDRDIDSFMKNDCDAEKWMIIELSQLGTVETVKLTMKELYSSRVHTFRVLGRSSHPRKDGPDFTSSLTSGTWQLLGSFTAENKRGMQSFSLPQRSRVRYLLLMFDTHYGNEQMCAMNWIEVLGVSAAQELEEALALQELEAEHEEHHTHTQHDHHMQHQQQQQQGPRHMEPQVPTGQTHHAHPQQFQQRTQELSSPAAQQQHQQVGMEQQQPPSDTLHHEQLQQQQAQAVPPATQAHPLDVAAGGPAGAAQGSLAESAAAAVPGADGAGSSHAVSPSHPAAAAAAARQEPPADNAQQPALQPDMQDSKQLVPEPPSGTGHAVTSAAAAQQQDSQQQQPSAANGSGSQQGEGDSAGSAVAPQAQVVAPGAGSPTGAAAAPDTPAQGADSRSQRVGEGGADPKSQQHPGQQQQQQQQPPQQQQQVAAHNTGQEVHSPGTAAPVQKQQQAAPVAPESRAGVAAGGEVAVATGSGAGQDAATAAYSTGHISAGVPQQQQAVQTGPIGQGRNGMDHTPSPQQQHQPTAQSGQSGSSNGVPTSRNGGDTGSVLDSRGSNKPKQAGNLFDVVKGEMMQLKLDQGKLTKKVDSLTKRSSDFDTAAAALQQQQAALSAQVERLSKKLDALVGTQAAAAAAQQQLRKDVSMLLAAQKEQGARQRVRYPHSGGAGAGVGPDTVLPDLHAAGQSGCLVDAPGRPLLPPVCARLPGEEPPLLLQLKYQWSVVTALAGTSLLGLWLVLHPKSWGMPQVLRLVVCVLALLNGILAVLLGLWLLVMQGLAQAASQAQVLLSAGPRLSVPVHRMLSNGSGWGDAPQ